MEPGILVGVDGSPSANAAVRWAARDAAMRHTTLTLVHAAAPVMGTWFATPVSTGVLERQHELGRQILDVATKIAQGKHTRVAADINRTALHRDGSGACSDVQ